MPLVVAVPVGAQNGHMTKERKSLLVALYVALIHVPVTVLTWRDLNSRPADQIRGPRVLWRLLSAANTGGTVAYWLIGRRKAQESLPAS